MEKHLPYDRSDKQSILAYAKLLEGNSLRSMLKDVIDLNETIRAGKGGFGNMVEELYFQYAPNSDAQPDFPEAKLELKTSPLKKIRRGFVSKERLVFNIINYMEEHKETFATSSFLKKNAELLLLFYLHEKEQLPIDYIFKIVRLWRFPLEDLKIIIDDWNKIVNKIREGKAHELSEGDTLYLGACTKGANKKSLRQQPFSDIPAMQRAFSLKSKYINFIIEQTIKKIEFEIDEEEYEYIVSESKLTKEDFKAKKIVHKKDLEPVVKSIHEYKVGQTFEDLIQEKFQQYTGWSAEELISHFNLQIKPNAKNKYNVICKRILGVTGKRIEEFEKAEISMKTIVLSNSGKLKESMSFPQIRYRDIVKEEWLDSTFYELITKRFFFVVFQRDSKETPRLKKVQFWTMPSEDLKAAEDFWEDTKSKIIAEEFNDFWKIKDDKIFHVRPKATNSKDLMETATGKLERKKSYWLNASYIKKIVS